jgi:glycosyltransferase involved in cell wall biosynthesis
MADSSSKNIIELEGAALEPDLVGPSQATVTMSFFIPCYNEEANVIGAVDKLVRVATAEKLSYEILIFDDCSQDRTVEIVRQYMGAHPELPLRLFLNRINRGVSRNFFEGAFHAKGRYYRLVCGDDIEPIESHLKMLQSLGQADIIIPHFTEIGGRKLHRHLISGLYTFLVNHASGNRLRYYNGCPIYRRYDVIRFHVETTGFGYQAEFLTRLLHEAKTYLEVPLVSIDREGSGSLNLRNFISVTHSLLKISLRRMRVVLFK